MERLDRHALVMAIWLPAGLVAAALAHFGLGAGGVLALGGAFVAILAALIGHVIVNAVTETQFSPRELGLGLVLYLAVLVSFGLSALTEPSIWAGRHFVALGGFVLLFGAFVAYLIIAGGLRQAFEAFDVVRSFRTDSGRRRR